MYIHAYVELSSLAQWETLVPLFSNAYTDDVRMSSITHFILSMYFSPIFHPATEGKTEAIYTRALMHTHARKRAV